MAEIDEGLPTSPYALAMEPVPRYRLSDEELVRFKALISNTITNGSQSVALLDQSGKTVCVVTLPAAFNLLRYVCESVVFPDKMLESIIDVVSPGTPDASHLTSAWEDEYQIFSAGPDKNEFRSIRGN